MREENYSFPGFWSGDDLPLRWKPVRDVCGQVSDRLKLGNVLLRDGGGHPLASHSGHAVNGLMEKVRTWALGLKGARMDEQRRKKGWVKRGNPCLFIKAVETMCLPSCPLKALIPQASR